VSQPTVSAHVPETEKEKIEIPGHTHNVFSSFSLYPDDVDFETRDEKERIIMLLRQHPIMNARWIITTALLLTGPTIISLFGIFSLLPTGFPLIISLSWYLVTSAYAIEGFLNWYFNVYIVTTERIVDVDFYNLIDKRVSSAEIDKIQDVSYTTGGVIRTMFNFGNITIQTASEVPEFDFGAVPNPEKVTKIIDDLRMKTE
jgi:hypothetical protein